MSLKEITGPLSAHTKKMASQDRMFGNLPDAAPKKTRVAGGVSEKGMLRLLNKFPGGEADDATLNAHQVKIRDYARKMREAGMDVGKYNIPGLDD